ncbi:hypothetical protein HDR60_05500 [bacterium]|nr:hypothetical protein [bacterium]
MNSSDFFLPISFISNEKEKKLFDERNKKFKSIEELLGDKELIRAMAFVNIMRKDRYLIDIIASIVNKIAVKAKLNVRMNDFANNVKLDIEIAKLRKNYHLRQRKLLNKNRSR